jgi:two-component system, LytTR family, sensor kinase
MFASFRPFSDKHTPSTLAIARPIFAVCGLLALAVLLGFLEAAQSYLRAVMQGRAFSWGQGLLDAIPAWAVLALLTPLVVALAHYVRFDRGRRVMATLIHTAGAAAFSLVHQSAAALLLAWRFDGRFTLYLPKMFTAYLAMDFVIYSAIVGAYFAVDYRRQLRQREMAASQLQASLSQARLQALRAQLNPHFLFNTLNAISVLALKGQGEAVAQTLSQLSELLRLSLDAGLPQEVPLEEELEFTDRYLAIQRIRFADRLTVTRTVDPDTLGALVPSLLLQPLVENAVMHGVGLQPGPGRIEIHAVKCGNRLRIQVVDSGPGFPGFPAADARREGIGLANTRARLEQLYPADYRLDTGGDNGARVAIDLPFRGSGFEAGRTRWSA